MSTVNEQRNKASLESLRQLADINRNLEIDQELGQAFHDIRTVLDRLHLSSYREQFEQLEANYRLMCDFMLKGYQDPQRPALYCRLLKSLSTFVRNVETAVKKAHDPFFSSLSPLTEGTEIDAASVEKRLVKFVQDVAMLSLDDEKRREEHARTLYDNHFAYVRDLFNAIVLSGQWNSGMAEDMAKLLVSPTIDAIDAQTLVSAITLATLNVPDPQKALSLMRVYAEATEETVRQRALAGWVFAVSQDCFPLFPEVAKNAGDLLDNQEVRNEVLQLQKQVIYCQNAAQDHETLQKDIMPTIMKNQDFEVTRFGIKEKADEPADDILHPDADDKKMEQLEESFRKISDMQKQGSDIYFGGFSQMKRFSFFYTFSNWLTPFYIEHPQLRHLSPQLLKSKFMQHLMQQGPFCDSDKYSFALTLSSVYANLPDNIRNMMESGELQGGMTGNEEALHTKAYIRRKYLQDLYRFFKLCDNRNKFANPFDNKDYHLFMTTPIFRLAMATEARNMERFLLKQKKYDLLSKLLDTHFDRENAEDVQMKAMLASRSKHYTQAEECYRHLLKLRPDDTHAMRGLAQACFFQAKYTEAEKLYHILFETYPENKNYALYLSIAKINNGEADAAAKLLYKLNYDYPDDLSVKRALAWAELWTKNTRQAHKIYDTILSSAKNAAADYINMGYCCFFEGNIGAAVRFLQQGVRTGQSDNQMLRKQMAQDKSLFDHYGISNVDRKILADLVDQEMAKGENGQ